MVHQYELAICIRYIYCDGGTIKTHYRHCPSGPLFAIQKNRIENFYLLLVGILRGLTVQVSDKSMEIGIHDNLITLISNHSRPTLGFAHEGYNLQSKMAAIEILKFAYNFNQVHVKAQGMLSLTFSKQIYLSMTLVTILKYKMGDKKCLLTSQSPLVSGTYAAPVR